MVARVVKFKSSFPSTGPHRTAETAPRQEAGYATGSRAGFPLSFVCPWLLSCPLLPGYFCHKNISRWRRSCAIAGHFYWAHYVVCTSHNHLAVGVLGASTKHPYWTNASIEHTLCVCALYWVHVCKKPFIVERHTTLHKDFDSVVVLSILFHFFCAGAEPTSPQMLGKEDATMELHVLSLVMIT